MNKQDWLKLINAIPDGADDVYIKFKVKTDSNSRKFDIAKRTFEGDEILFCQDGDEITLEEDKHFNTLEIICTGSIE